MISAWQLFFNFYILSLGYNKDFLGLVNAAPWLASLLFGIPMGMLSDRIGRRKSMLAGLAVNVTGLAAQALVHQPAALVLTAFTGGSGYALWMTCSMPFMMSVSTDENRALLFSLNAGLVTLAGAGGSLVAGQLPALFARWLGVLPGSAAAYRGVLLFSVALSFASLLPVFLIREVPRGIESRPRREGMLRILTRPVIWKLMLPYGLIGIGAGLLIPYLNIFLSEKFHLPDPVLGYLYSLSALVTGLSIVIGPRLARRLKSKIRTTVISQSASLLFLMILGSTWLPWLAGISFVLRVAFMNLASPLYNAFSMEQVDPQEQGAASGLFITTNTLGGTLGPFVSGLIQQRYGFSPLFMLTGILYGASILFMQFFFRKVEQSVPQVTAASPG